MLKRINLRWHLQNQKNNNKGTRNQRENSVSFMSNGRQVSFMVHVAYMSPLFSSILLRDEVTLHHPGTDHPSHVSIQDAFLHCRDWWICMRLGEGRPKWPRKMNLGDFSQTAPAPAPKGHSLLCDFSYRCLFFRFTQIDLQNVQLPELWAPSKLDVNQTDYLIHHLRSTLTKKQTEPKLQPSVLQPFVSCYDFMSLQ